MLHPRSKQRQRRHVHRGCFFVAEAQLVSGCVLWFIYYILLCVNKLHTSCMYTYIYIYIHTCHVPWTLLYWILFTSHSQSFSAYREYIYMHHINIIYIYICTLHHIYI